MKRSKYIFSVLFLLVLFALIYRIYSNSQKIDKIYEFRCAGIYDGILNDYFNKYDEFPVSLNNGYEFYISSYDFDENEQNNAKEHFSLLYNDPFSDSLLKYIPLKDSLTKKYLGFILISVGQDHIFNNSFKELELNNFEKKLTLYNKYEDNITISYDELHISIFNRLISGKKDILAYYWSIPDYYLQIAGKENNLLNSDLDSFLTKHYFFKKNKPSTPEIMKQLLPLFINVDSLRIINNKVIFPFENFEVECQLTIDINYLDLSKQYLTLVGLLDSIDKLEKRIYFKNCLPINKPVD